MLSEKVQHAQQGSEQEMLDLLEQFMPLLKKYARKLMTEDALSDLTIKFLESIKAIRLEHLKSTQDGVIVKYIASSVKNAYIALLKEILKEKGENWPIFWDDLTETQKYNLISDNKETTQLQRFMDLLNGCSQLTDKERKILKLIYFDEYSSADVAKIFATTRQNINQIKLRALEKMRQ